MTKYTSKPEHILQASVAQFFDAWLAPGVPWSSADHGITFSGSALQRMAQWQRLAARGVKKGLPDIPIVFYDGHLHCIELKAPGGVVTAEQAQWGERIVAQGGTWDVCESRAEVWASMHRAFPRGCPLRAPDAIVQMWLAKDGSAPRQRTVKASKKPGVAKPGKRRLAAGTRMALAMARGR